MTHTLTRAQWNLLHAIDLEGLDVTTMAVWRPTEQGRLLVALRREI